MNCKTAKLAAALLALSLLLCSCGDSGSSASSGGSGGGQSAAASVSEDAGPYVAPAFADSVFQGTQASAEGEAVIDTSSVSSGYVAVSAVSSLRLKFSVVYDDGSEDGVKYNYDLHNDGTPDCFPLQSGDGHYTFKVMQAAGEDADGRSQYAKIAVEEADVTLDDQFQPFLRPSVKVRYTQASECVKKAAELAETAGDELGLVSAVYDFICGSVTYDHDIADGVTDGTITSYDPDPDETMASGKGICYDYAVLAASMLRSQGIPCKMIFGYVSPNDIYHAWNMFYTEETGWVTVSYQVSGDSWNRLDLTFSANGSDDSFIGDGENYSDVYIY